MEITIWQAKHFFLPNIVNIADLPSVLTTVESIQVYNDVKATEEDMVAQPDI